VYLGVALDINYNVKYITKTERAKLENGLTSKSYVILDLTLSVIIYKFVVTCCIHL